MRSFYEAFWADAPPDPEPWEWERRRALLLGEVKPGERVLDLGCGAGRFLVALREAGADPIGVEIAQAAAERARAKGVEVRLVEPDGSLPLGHGEIDLVWCSETLEHIPDVAHTLHEVRRVLKPGGRLLATVPYNPPIALVDRLDPLGQHVRFFTPRTLARTLDAFGYTRLRLAAHAALLFLGAIFILILVARRSRLPRAVVATTGAAILLFALSNPERRIATHNLERYERTAKIDRDYLRSLGADAALPCGEAPESDGIAGFNLSRAAARRTHTDRRTEVLTPCGPPRPTR